ncbi:MAG: hypothetical protein R2867_26160 [Caldilineaceae bacterium]
MTEPLTTVHLLQIWEEGQSLPLYQAATLLLQATLPMDEHPAMGAWTVGQRDRHLLEIREWLFGSTMPAVARCPTCGEQAEFTLTVPDLYYPAFDMTEPHHFAAAGYQVTYQLPTLAHLTAVAERTDRRTAILTHCILDATYLGEPIESATLPASILNAIATQMGEADPQADIQLDMRCPSCDTQWQTPFDIAHYLWRELDTWARRVQREVHIIASAYGWSEAQILQLSPVRRQAYIQLILENR